MPLVFLGTDHPCDCYVLRIHLAASTRLRFGGFKKKKLVELRAGEYAYVGSALSLPGSTSLARRLVRHATRSADKAPHAIRDAMLERFTAIGLTTGDLLPRGPKRLHWNIDHLLDLDRSRIDRRLPAAHHTPLGSFVGTVHQARPPRLCVRKRPGRQRCPRQYPHPAHRGTCGLVERPEAAAKTALPPLAGSRFNPAGLQLPEPGCGRSRRESAEPVKTAPPARAKGHLRQQRRQIRRTPARGLPNRRPST